MGRIMMRRMIIGVDLVPGVMVHEHHNHNNEDEVHHETKDGGVVHVVPHDNDVYEVHLDRNIIGMRIMVETKRHFHFQSELHVPKMILVDLDPMILCNNNIIIVPPVKDHIPNVPKHTQSI